MSNLSDFTISGDKLIKYNGTEREVVVPDGITTIEREAFAHNKLETVSLPDSLVTIGDLAFSYCSALIEVSVPNNVSSIGTKAFEGCSKLKKLTLASKITYIPFSMCSGCSELESIEIPQGVTSISKLAFATCYCLKKISLPNTLKSIDDHAFAWNSDLEEIILPDSLKTLGQFVFLDCKKLRKVYLPSGLEEVVWEPFVECSCCFSVKQWSPVITKAVKIAHVLSIITDDISLVPAKYRPEAAIGFATQDNIDIDSEQWKAYISFISKNIAKLCPLAFSNPEALYFLCQNKLIKPKDIHLFVEEAERCDNAEIKALILNYQNSLGMNDVIKERDKREKEQEAIAVERAASRDGKTGIEGLTFVVTGDLSYKWASRSNIKEFLERFGAKLGTAVTKNTDYLVCNDLQSNTDKAVKARELGIEIINEADFNQMIGRQYKNEEHIVVADWITNLSYQMTGKYNFTEHMLKGCNKAKSIILPKNLTVVDYNDFESLENLETITIPKSVEGIKQLAFLNCPSLKSVIIEEGVKYIEENAFFTCESLEKIVIPNSVTRMEKIFYDCPKAVIYALTGSYAEEFAKKNDIPFAAL